MEDNKNWLDAFRIKNGGDAWTLKVTVMEEGIEVKNIEEVVDCPKGEAGVWCAHNLLGRLANEALKGTKLETLPWREFRRMGSGASKNYLYRKVKNPDNYAKAEMEWGEGW